MTDLSDIHRALAEKRPEPWDLLPDLGLYMDQVIFYLNRDRLTPPTSPKLTAAMVNNYVKEGLVPRAEGKRYDREHLARLQAVVWLKEVLSVKDTGRLLNAYIGDHQIEEKYGDMLADLSVALDRIGKDLPGTPDREDVVDTAFKLAVASYAAKVACTWLLALLDPEGEAGRPKEKIQSEVKSKGREKV
jgi:DNA-binding transcriptional MerR regulator